MRWTRARVVDEESPMLNRVGDVLSYAGNDLVFVQLDSEESERSFKLSQVVNDDLLCRCGSGQYFHRLYDARNIYVGRCCEKCEAELRSHYRPEIFSDGNYWADEPIEED